MKIIAINDKVYKITNKEFNKISLIRKDENFEEELPAFLLKITKEKKPIILLDEIYLP